MEPACELVTFIFKISSNSSLNILWLNIIIEIMVSNMYVAQFYAILFNLSTVVEVYFEAYWSGHCLEIGMVLRIMLSISFRCCSQLALSCKKLTIQRPCSCACRIA